MLSKRIIESFIILLIIIEIVYSEELLKIIFPTIKYHILSTCRRNGGFILIFLKFGKVVRRLLEKKLKGFYAFLSITYVMLLVEGYFRYFRST